MKTYVNTDKILRVHVRMSTKSNSWKWRDATPDRTRFFGLIKVKGAPAGWRYYGNHEDSVYTEEYVLKESSEKGRIFKKADGFWDKARVEIESLGGKYTHSDYAYFERDEEALEYAKEIAEKFPHIQVNYTNC